LIEQAIRKKGFSVVEVFTPCPTGYGRRNKMRTPVDMMNWLKENAIPKSRAARMSPEELKDKIVTGILVDVDLPEYTQEYQKLIERVRK
jgi:2-oxoglutarate ferredoxin oxidoreductase subunit beta